MHLSKSLELYTQRVNHNVKITEQVKWNSAGLTGKELCANDKNTEDP